MSFLKKLFGGGGGAGSAPEPVMHNDFLIFPEPVKESNGYRISARIEKVIGDDTKVHNMIRADIYQSKDTAIEASVTKAKQFIDQMGDQIFR